MANLAHTSVPDWFAGPADDAAPAAMPVMPATDGRSHLLVGVGPAALDQVASWATGLGPADVGTVVADDPARVEAAFAAALARARVGVRVAIAGPAGDCLALRAVAVQAGVEDDELLVAPTGSGSIALWCAHCAGVTTVAAAIDDVVPCAGCDRNLLVYHHVSRRTGHFLGYQVDAEELAS